MQRGKVSKKRSSGGNGDWNSGRLHNLSLLSFGKERNCTSFTYFSL